MKNSPNINFKRVNENVATATPSLGISHILARTTKGPFNNPEKVITSVSQFRSIYGREIVPDNTVSNIERALSTGSSVRVSRVEGGTGATKGTAKSYDTENGTVGETDATIPLVISNPVDATEKITVSLKITTKEAGASVINPNLPSGDNNFFLKLVKNTVNTLTTYTLSQYKIITDEIIDGQPDLVSGNELNTSVVLRGSKGEASHLNFIDFEAFADFYYNNPNVEFSINAVTTDIGGISILSIEDLIAVMRVYRNWNVELTMATTALYYVINEGTDGGESTQETWLRAYQAMAGYNDGYQLIASHLHLHLPLGYEPIYKAILDEVTTNGEIILYVEVPKTGATGLMNYSATLAKLKTMVAAVGNVPFVSYFGGGLKFYDDNAALRNNDVLGTVLGLGDSSAVNYGPWKSFAGMNRGIVIDGQGNTITDGKALSYNQLNELANNSLNLFIVQDTPTTGKRTMLWHNFTGSLENSSDRFLSSMRAYLYLKKNIRPILQKYIEEQNTFSTWRNIYEEVLPILQPLVGEVYTTFEWKGDQFATSYDELQVNNELDVRQGKYKVVLSYRDIVTLQEITMEFFIEKANSSVSVQ